MTNTLLRMGGILLARCLFCPRLRSGGDEKGHRVLRQRGSVHDAPGPLRRAGEVPEEPGGLPGAEEVEIPPVLLRLQPRAAPGAQPGVRPCADAAVL